MGPVIQALSDSGWDCTPVSDTEEAYGCIDPESGDRFIVTVESVDA